MIFTKNKFIIVSAKKAEQLKMRIKSNFSSKTVTENKMMAIKLLQEPLFRLRPETIRIIIKKMIM